MVGLTHLLLTTLALFPADVGSFAFAPSRTLVEVKAMNTMRPYYASFPTALRATSAVDDAKEFEGSLNDKTSSWLKSLDKHVLKRIIRIGNHSPTLISLSYFGLMSMNMGGMKSHELSPLASALVRPLGTTSNAQFSNFFPTQVTPATFVFYVWPLISVVQLATVAYSALRPKEPLLSQSDLTCLSLANLASTAWLVVSSRTVAGSLPLASFLTLPLVPLISGYPLREGRWDPQDAEWKNGIFQLYSSFTTVASMLAFAVELQYGGRIPFFQGRGEVVSAIFLAMYAMLVGLPGQGIIKRCVNAGAIGGILAKRIADGITFKSALSVSFIGTCLVAIGALLKVPDKDD